MSTLTREKDPQIHYKNKQKILIIPYRCQNERGVWVFPRTLKTTRPRRLPRTRPAPTTPSMSRSLFFPAGKMEPAAHTVAPFPVLLYLRIPTPSLKESCLPPLASERVKIKKALAVLKLPFKTVGVGAL